MVTQCWISRPMEKTIFLRFMYCMTGFSIALTLVEIGQLGARRVRRQVAKEGRLILLHNFGEFIKASALQSTSCVSD